MNERIAELAALISYHAQMRGKYEQAAVWPLLSAPADPPAPPDRYPNDPEDWVAMRKRFAWLPSKQPSARIEVARVEEVPEAEDEPGADHDSTDPSNWNTDLSTGMPTLTDQLSAGRGNVSAGPAPGKRDTSGITLP
jgi:hypothetical protein